jgi:hypothetical protein
MDCSKARRKTMAGFRSAGRVAPDPNAPAFSVPPKGYGGFSAAVHAQLAQVLRAQGAMQRDIGSILSTQAASGNRIGSLEIKVSGLNRLVWIGMGMGATVAAVAAIIVPFARFLVHNGAIKL